MDVPCHYTFEIFVSNLSNVLGFTFSPSMSSLFFVLDLLLPPKHSLNNNLHVIM